MDTTITILHDKLTALNDVPAFEECYRQYFVRLYRFCFSIVHQKQPAEDIVQNVFMQLWKKREESPAIRNLEVYLYVSVKNLSLNYLRNTSSRIVDIAERSHEYIQFNADPETLLIHAEAVKKMNNAIRSLPPRCKLIFKLIKEDGLKYKDVATLLDLSLKTVEGQLAIAMRKLIKAMAD
ncbi:MAG TPA: RNA polymerase sigma-70 factor [Puia sp.]|jgi:RNA polymerase sigma-70 factor (ECF subfamily)